MAQNRFWRVVVFLKVEPVGTPKVRNPTFSGNARSTKENDVIALLDPLLQHFSLHILTRPYSSLSISPTGQWSLPIISGYITLSKSLS